MRSIIGNCKALRGSRVFCTGFCSKVITVQNGSTYQSLIYRVSMAMKENEGENRSINVIVLTPHCNRASIWESVKTMFLIVQFRANRCHLKYLDPRRLFLSTRTNAIMTTIFILSMTHSLKYDIFILNMIYSF